MAMEHFEAEKLREVDHMKSRFFANISHEFRTPLTLILGPVKQMLAGKFSGNFKEQYKLNIRNAGRLLNLVNQLLDLSRMESGKLKLKAQEIDICSLTNGLVQAFESLARKENIRLTFSSEIDEQELFIDVEKYETILNNLLSNAFKATPQGGAVAVAISPLPEASPLTKGGKRGVLIAVSNTGPGIPAEQLEHIFERFYQVGNSYQKDEQGTGIGLSLTKELVELHHGTIGVRSEPDIKTTFNIWHKT